MQYINLRGHFNRKQSVFTTDRYLGYIIISWETLICEYHHSFPQASWPLGSISIAKGQTEPMQVVQLVQVVQTVKSLV